LPFFKDGKQKLGLGSVNQRQQDSLIKSQENRQRTNRDGNESANQTEKETFMGTSTLEATNPAIPNSGPYDEKHPGKTLFIPNDKSGKQKKEMVVLAYALRPEKVDEFKTSFFEKNVRQFYKDKGAEHVHSWIYDNHLMVLATPEVNVPWLGTGGIQGLEKYVVGSPAAIEALPVFP